MAISNTLAIARDLDARDSLANFRDRFHFDSNGKLYLDGNSLGRPPKRSIEVANDVLLQEWGEDLITSWSHWQKLPLEVGDLVAREILGAKAGEVLIADSTTTNLYKTLRAARSLLVSRGVACVQVVTEEDNFPTDLYLTADFANELGVRWRTIKTSPGSGIDMEDLQSVLAEGPSLLCLSHVSYKSGAKVDMKRVNDLASRSESVVVWDLSHSAGSTEVDLNGDGALFAVGCTYKYLNGGPGAPAFIYVKNDVTDIVETPIKGWFSQQNQFEMDSIYSPRPGIGKFSNGTPNVIGTYLVREGARLIAEAGIAALAEKGRALGDFFIDLFDENLSSLGYTLESPRERTLRGSHVTLGHEKARQLVPALTASGVVPDFRTPDLIRFGFASSYVSFHDLYTAVEIISKVTSNMA
ncbi:MAG: aminotransferase class V-fold PLP-dependent enzyme [Actinomycetota bacterium]|nr:aminotransferase class V-fold PLP-dependent enzyme [Actinomycetota bacterium]